MAGPDSSRESFEYEVTAAANLAAGKQVRWLPWQQASGLALPGNDFWLFDGTAVWFNYFGGDGAAGRPVRQGHRCRPARFEPGSRCRRS